MKRILILVALSLFLCSTASAFQGGGGESTKKKAVPKKKNSATKSNNTTPPRPPAPPARSETPTPSPAPPLTGNLQVKVQIGSEPRWLKVWIDANRPADGILNPGDVREFVATEKMILSFRNAVGITATLNGRPMKLPLTKGVASYVVLTKDNYQTFLR